MEDIPPRKTGKDATSQSWCEFDKQRLNTARNAKKHRAEKTLPPEISVGYSCHVLHSLNLSKNRIDWTIQCNSSSSRLRPGNLGRFCATHSHFCDFLPASIWVSVQCFLLWRTCCRSYANERVHCRTGVSRILY